MSADGVGDVVRVCAEGEIMSRMLSLVCAVIVFSGCAVEEQTHGRSAPLQDVASGVVSTTALRHVSIPAAGATAAPGEAWFDRMRWQIPDAGGVYFPITIDSGCTIVEYAINVFRVSWQQPMSATLIESDPTTGETHQAASVSADPDLVGNRKLSSGPIAYSIPDAKNAYLELWTDSQWVASYVYSADIWYTCTPPPPTQLPVGCCDNGAESCTFTSDGICYIGECATNVIYTCP